MIVNEQQNISICLFIKAQGNHKESMVLGQVHQEFL